MKRYVEATTGEVRVAVARNIPATEMIVGRRCAVIFFDETNPGDAVVVGVYS